MCFDSSSSTASTSQQFDKRNAVDSGVGVSGDSNNVTVNNTSDGAFKLADSALTAGQGSAFLSAWSAKNSMDAVGAATDHALITSTTTNKDALAFAGGSLTIGNAALHDALASASSATKDALAASGRATSDALAASTKTASEALSAVTASNNSSLAFADHLAVTSYDLVNRAQGQVAATAADALGYGAHVIDLAFSAGKTAQDTTANAVNQVARAYDTATNYQAEKATTDSRYLVIAGMVVVAIMALKVMNK